jgi:hypothetical protein
MLMHWMNKSPSRYFIAPAKTDLGDFFGYYLERF